ncbi:MAG TPA: hypothetical protein VIW29_06275 [Polyangiaceae bacterium]
MASRAPMIHQYPASGALRPRRDVWFRADEEPVVLPRRSSWSVNFTLIAAGLAAAVLTFGAATLVYGIGAPVLGPREPASLTPTWTPDSQPVRALLTERLNRQAQLAPSQAQPAPAQSVSPAPGERELTGDEAQQMSLPPETSFTIERPVKPEEPNLPMPAQRPEAPVQPPYPNPTTTPPEIMPQDAPRLPDPENPY